MTGRIVFEPTGEHHCVVTFRLGDNGCGRVDIGNAAEFAQPGTVLQCDCRATFVAQPWQPGEMFPRWRREGRVARWRRERRQIRAAWRPPARGLGSGPGIHLLPEVSADPDVLPPSAAIVPPEPPPPPGPVAKPAFWLPMTAEFAKDLGLDHPDEPKGAQ